MSQVSKHKLNPQTYAKIFSLFPQFLNRLSRKGKEQILINALFSQTEQTVIAKRIAIAFMLTKGYTYHQIMSQIKVSLGTVAKIAALTKNADEIFAKELQSIAKEEQFVGFLNTIGYKLETALPPKGGNWSAWRRKIEEAKRNSREPF